MLHEGQDEDDIADILSDNYGWFINSFKSEQIEMPTK
jgi:cytochrome c-type biogenesis protein CcmH/NrfF